MTKARKLRELFDAKDVIRIVGAHDGLGAKLIEQNGFEGVWASGFEISSSHCLPDANILTMSEYLERACEMNNAVDIPIIADCDTGYGNANNVIHMVKKYETAGIAGVCIEDKLFPKVNSFIPGRQELAPIAEFVGKIMAAKNAQQNPDFMVIARVEALIAGWGLSEALKRAHEYAKAGADAILIHSKSETSQEIKDFCLKWNNKAPLVIVPTTYPDFHINDMAEFGIKMVVYANHGMRASIKAMNDIFQEIKEQGHISSINNRIVSMAEVFDLQGMTKMKKTEGKYLKSGKDVTVVIPAAGDPSYEESMKDIVKDYPIAMLDINGKSILQRNTEVLRSLSIQDIYVITGFQADKVKVEDINYIENMEFNTTTQVDSIMLAEQKIKSNTLIAFSDILFEKEIIQKLMDSGKDIALAIDGNIPEEFRARDYVKTEFPFVKSSRRISPKRFNKIVEISKETPREEANFEFIGLSYFSEEGIAIFKKYYYELKDKGNTKVDFLDVIQAIIDAGIEVSGVEVSGGWLEIRSLENYKSAHSLF